MIVNFTSRHKWDIDNDMQHLSIPRTIRQLNCRQFVRELGQEKLISKVNLHNDRIHIESLAWRDYWRQAMPFIGHHRRLHYRLNRLKNAWRNLLRCPKNRLNQVMYCWSYFSLLHHCLILARRESQHTSCLSALSCIIGLESFTIHEKSEDSCAAGIIASRNPVYLLGRLSPAPPLPTAKHVPLVLPCGWEEPFYHYRRLTLTGRRSEQLLMFPSVRMIKRPVSFRLINRLSQALRWNPDPYYGSRASTFTARILHPLFNAQLDAIGCRKASLFRILDLGAGTGQFILAALSKLRHLSARYSASSISLHFVDSTGPQPIGWRLDAEHHTLLRGSEWISADYRELIDDHDWLVRNGSFDVAVISRVLDCFSFFSIEPARLDSFNIKKAYETFAPAYCLSPQREPYGLANLAVKTVRCRENNGFFMPQWSLSEYFAAIQAIMLRDLRNLNENTSCLPLRRFNPASLFTKAGSSIIVEILRVAYSLVIDDHDLTPADLLDHRRSLGLHNTAAVQVVGGGRRIGPHQLIITKPEIADKLEGRRLW